MRNNTFLFAILIIVFILISCQNNKDKTNYKSQKEEKSEEKITNEKSEEEYTEYEVSDNESFLALFPEIDTIPTSDLVFSYKFDPGKAKSYRNFSSHIKYDLCGDYSGYEWYYQPLFKVKTENGFISYMIGYESTEYSEGPEFNTEDIIIIMWKRKDNGEYRNEHWPFRIAQRENGEIKTYFKYLNNNLNSLEIVSKDELSVQLQYIDSRFYNMKKWMMVKDEMQTPELGLTKILSQITKIDDSWSTQKALKTESPNKDSINRLFSLYFHRKTELGTVSLSSPQEMVPVLNFLGYKAFPDSTYIIIWESEREFREKGELKLALLNDLDKVIDFISLPYNNEIENQIRITNEGIHISTKTESASNKTIFVPTKEGLVPKKELFEKRISSYKNYSFPLKIDYEWTENQKREGLLTPYGYVDIIGKIETNSLYIILTYDFNEITSGSHSVSINVDGTCIDKQTLKEKGVFKFYFYFSDAGEETLGNFKDGLFAKYDQYEDYETSEMVTRPTDTLYLTNQGMFYRYAITSQPVEPNIEILTHFEDLNSTSNFSRYEEYKMKRIMNNQGSNEDELFRYIYANRYSEKVLENYIPKCIPHGKFSINDSTFVLLWHRSPIYTNQNVSSEKTAMEAAVYNYSDQPKFTFINQIPVWIDEYEEVLQYVNQKVESLKDKNGKLF